MTETKQQPKFVLVCWPLWCLAKPERSQRTKFYVGLQQADGSITLLRGPTKDQAEAEGLLADPQRVKLLMKMEREDELWRQRVTRLHPEPFDEPTPPDVRAAVSLTRKPPPGLFAEGGT